MTYDTGNKNPAPFQINFGARQKVDIVLGDAYMITVFGLFVNSLSYDCGGKNKPPRTVARGGAVGSAYLLSKYKIQSASMRNCIR